MNDQSQMMNQRRYGLWPLPPPEDPTKFQNLSMPSFPGVKPGRSNWKGKKGFDNRRKEKRVVGSGSSAGGVGGYKPPTLHELQTQNRAKARRFYPKKRFNRFAPFAPRNTSSYIIRAKKSGGIASLVSPCPVTPAILPTPIFSPSREVLVDMAKEQWGVDGYGSMKGLIRLRSPGHEAHDDDEEEEGESSESDVEEHVEVERRLDHDLSRFEMIYPNSADDHTYLLENRVDDQDTHIAQLEEENLTLKERLFLMESELGDLRMRLQFLETDGRANENHEEVSENASENEAKEENIEEVLQTVSENDVKEENIEEVLENASENEGDVCSKKSIGDGD
ncbi:hypothetical protein HHK36_012016 [Tetracentron sinense]|uniref:PRLI-interacting factor A n=1 Tax=Tetracentron sinense TaxID=13715 RepID=A0A834ZBR1_TETSI|nr:hypothetical protein HHK36_012016 [Tetracentron sinense]